MENFSFSKASNDIQVGTFASLSRVGIKHGISTRNCGVSTKPYSSLNLAFHVGDEEAAVLQNRQLLCRAMSIDYKQLVTAEQVHGEQIAIVRAERIGAEGHLGRIVQ